MLPGPMRWPSFEALLLTILLAFFLVLAVFVDWMPEDARKPKEPTSVRSTQPEELGPRLRVLLDWGGALAPPVEAELEGASTEPARGRGGSELSFPARLSGTRRLRLAAELGAGVVLHLRRTLTLTGEGRELRFRFQLLPLRLELGDARPLWLRQARADAADVQIELGAAAELDVRIPEGSYVLGSYEAIAPNEPPRFRALLDFEHREAGTALRREPAGGWRAEALR